MASKKSTKIDPKILIGVVVVIVIGIGLFAFSSQNQSTPAPQPTPTAVQEIAADTYSLEFVNIDKNNPNATYLIVTSKTEDVRNQLPITIEFLKNGKSVWKDVIEDDAAKVCRDATGCGIDGPTFDSLNVQANETLEVVVTGKDGAVLDRDSGAAN